MIFQVIHSHGDDNARSRFRVIEQPAGREVEWVNRFLDRECVRRLADNTLRSYAMDLLHFLRWWASVNHTDVISESALSATVLLDYLRFQSGHHPQPAAATINRRVGVVERALRCLYHHRRPGLDGHYCHGDQLRRRHRRRLLCQRHRPWLSSAEITELLQVSPKCVSSMGMTEAGTIPSAGRICRISTEAPAAEMVARCD